MISAATPAPTTRLSTSIPPIPTTAQRMTRTIPVTTIVLAVGSMPSTVSAQGAPRYATVVLAAA